MRLVYPSKIMIALLVLLAALGVAGCSLISPVVEGSGNPAVYAQEDKLAVESHGKASIPKPGPRIMRFTQISVEQGMSQSVVEAIAQDSQGFVWFATQDGLNRFDGYTLKVYQNDPANLNSLSHSQTTTLLADRQGGLWVGTYNAGLNHFDPSTGHFTRYKDHPDDPDSLSSGNITALLEDRDGTIWVGTYPGGLNRFDPQTGRFQHYRSSPDDPSSLSNDRVLALMQAKDGSLWVGTAAGLDHLNPTTGQFRHFQNDPDNPASLAGRVNHLAEDSRGRIWASVGNRGVDRLDPQTEHFTHYRSDPDAPGGLNAGDVSTVFHDSTGTIWVGIMGGGLCQHVDDEAGFTCYQHRPDQRDSLSSNNVLSITEDRSGILWVGTYGGGVNRLLPGYKQFIHLKSDPNQLDNQASNMVFALYQDEPGDLWIGTSGAGLDRLDRTTGQVTHYRADPENPHSLIDDRVRVIYRDRSGVLWVGTTYGLHRLDDPDAGAFTRFTQDTNDPNSLSGSNITGICEDPAGRLWIATENGGLNSYERGSRTFTRYLPDPDNPESLASRALSSLYCDRKGILWAGTLQNGLEKLDPRSGKVEHFRHDPENSQSLSDNFVLSILEDHQGTVWVGTTNGLNRFDSASGTFLSYHIRDGLPNDFIYGLLEDEQGRLWMSTNKGLSRFDLKTGQFKNYDEQDGLQSSEFNMGAAFRTTHGELLFGGINGTTAFFPAAIHDNPYLPPVVLTSVTQQGKELLSASWAGPNDQIEIRWPDNFFDFEFTALNYSRTEKNRYAYFLEGFDRGWNEIGVRHSGRYTNLPGRTYTLRLKGANNDGLWNEAGTSLRVKVIPPFWATWWFRGMLVILLISGTGCGLWLQIRGVKLRNQALERMVQARTMEIQALYEQTRELAVIEERNRLARDLHDSAKQKAFAALAQLGAANGLVRGRSPKAQDALVEAETLVYEVIEELTFLIQEMYPAALKEKGLAEVLREYFYEWESRTDIQVNFQIQSDRPLDIKIEQSLYRITQESLANVARHSCARQVTVEVIYHPDRVTVSIADDGNGFNLNRRIAGIGMRSMRERMALIGGDLSIQSAPGQGTRVLACAPTSIHNETS